MDFLKKHYEKVLLGVVLLGLAVGAVFLIFMIPAERRSLEEQSDKIINRPAKPLPEVNLAKTKALVGRVGTEDCLDLGAPNKVFNSMPWQKKSDGTLYKLVTGNEIGPGAVVVTKITPLNLTMTFDSTDKIGDKLYYVIITQNEAATKYSERRRRSSALLNVKKDSFTVREVHGSPENPTEVVIELEDTNQRITLVKDRPFTRVEGYLADFKYPPDNRSWTNKRVGDGGPGTSPIIFAGESYIVVAISKDELVLSAKSNNKKTPIAYSP